MEYKVFATELKAKDDFTFEGYASIFGNRDSWDDIMEQGAFKKTIKENFKRIKILAYHRITDVIGKPLKLEEDSKGLAFEGQISDTTIGRDMNTLIKDKVITEMSIGYNAIKWEYDADEGIRYLKEVRLWEISPVTWGANEKANIKRLPMNGEYDKMKAEIEALKALIEELKAGNSTFKSNKPLKELIEDPDQIQSLINEISKYK